MAFYIIFHHCWPAGIFYLLPSPSMIVLEKGSRTLVFLKALGAYKGIMSIFLLNGLLLGSIGASAGSSHRAVHCFQD